MGWSVWSTVLWIAAAVVAGVVFIWLFPLKLVSRLADRLGHSMPCPAALSFLVDNPLRRPAVRAVIERLDIQPGECVLELGPGPGAFTVSAAHKVGPDGKLIAVDIQPQMIAQVEKRAAKAGLVNVEPHVASAYELPVEDASVDRAFLVTVLPEIPDRARALAELYRVLKPGGLLSVSEEFSDPDYLFAPETLRCVEAAGFRPEHRFGSFWLYTINFRKPG